MKIGKFEDVIAWQRGRELARMDYEMTMREQFRYDFDQIRQIRRASSSIMHNIAEGFGSGTDAEMIRFLRIARRSAGEVQSESCLAIDLNYISNQEFQTLYRKAEEIKKLINAFIRYLTQSRNTTNSRKRVTTND